MTEIVDPLTLAAPPRPGVTVAPDEPSAAPPPEDPGPMARGMTDQLIDPLAGLYFEVIDYAEVCRAAYPGSPFGCGAVTPPGGRMFKMPDGTRRCGRCAGWLADPAVEAERQLYRREYGAELPLGFRYHPPEAAPGSGAVLHERTW
jgi:hypothetical protein